MLIDGRFELVRRLGEGGQAVVFAAADRRLGVDRALKILLPDLAARPKLRARFESEARTMALLDHPNIVRVHDVCASGKTVYSVMDLVPGGSLSSHLSRNGPFPPDLAVKITLQICAGLAVAHAAGVVHRDIKPHNVLLGRDGTAKIVDFGIARTADGHRTRSNAAMGTVGFMAPEQLQDARSADARADVYGLGMTLFVLVTGAEPVEWLRAHRHPRLPRSLEPILERAIAERPDDRYPTVQGLAEALVEALPTLPADSAEITFTDEVVEEETDEGPTLEQVAGWFTSESAPAAGAAGTSAPARSPGGTPTPTGTRGGGAAPTPTPGGSRSAGATPRPVGYTMSRPVAARGEGEARPEWLAEDPAKGLPTGFEVKLEQEEREAAAQARARRAADRADGTPVPIPPEPPLAPGSDEDPANKAKGVLVRTFDLLGKLPLGVVGPVFAMFAAAFVFLGWQQVAEQQAEAERRRAAEVALETEVLAQREIAGALAALGADGEHLESLFQTYEHAKTKEERARVAALIHAQLDREADQLLVEGSATSTRVEASLEELDAALDEYRATHPQEKGARPGGG